MRRIALIYNPMSGFFIDQGSDNFLSLLEATVQAYPDVDVRLFPFDFKRLDALQTAVCYFDPEAIWVAGGDGTVLCMAQLAITLNKPLGVLPAGTMNLLARDLGMSLDIPSAIQQLITAQAGLIDMAEVNGQPFLCISNIGMSTKLTERREQLRAHTFWVRLPLLAWHMLKFVFTYPSSKVSVHINGQRYSLHTRSITVSNNLLAPHSSIIPVREGLSDGKLGVYVTKDTSLWSLPRLVLRLLGKTWQSDPDLLQFETDQLLINFKHKRHVRVMCDGELHKMRLPLRYRLNAGMLCVLKPSPIV
ncbi:MAG: hypothetical protein RI964_2016 [Pseudomonadota bacterium]